MITAMSRGHRVAVAAATAVVCASLSLSLGAVDPAHAAAPEPDLLYSMDDVSGATVPDTSGNDWDGTIVGQSSVVPGQSGSALNLAGGSVSIPRPVLEGATDLTVSTRVRWNGGPAWQWIFGIGSDTTRYLFATPSNDQGDFRAAVTRNGAGADVKITSADALRGDEWTTVTLTLDTASDSLTAYINGLAVSTATTDISAGELLTATATSAGSIGLSFYPDPSFKGAIDDFRVYRQALSPSDVAGLVDQDLPVLEGLQNDAVAVRTSVGTAPQLPASVSGSYSDDYGRDVPVTWDSVPAERYASSGQFTVVGTAGGFPVTATVTVTRGEVRIDLSKTTGPVKGGAAGVLYGLYGDGSPTDNLIEGMNLQTLSTKAQDGAQHPGSDALEVLPSLVRTTGGDVYMRVIDWYRGFPYRLPGATRDEKLADYRAVLDQQLDKVALLTDDQREHLVIEPFNEPEGNTFGTGEESVNGISWLDDPTDFYAAWDYAYERIKARFPDLRVAGPDSSTLFPQVKDYLQHTLDAGTLPDIIAYHQLTNPQDIRASVAAYRSWEAEVFDGTDEAGTELPININEYAFNYHTSVPGQMIQWFSAIEDTKVDGMVAFWNINGNLSDSAVQQNRANGQWWLFNAYAALSGETVEVTPPQPGVNYTLQGIAALDEDKTIARAIIGGASGAVPVDFANLPDAFGDTVRIQVREIPWTGQLGDSPQPTVVSDSLAPVSASRTATFDFGSVGEPSLAESSAYEIVVTPGEGAQAQGSQARWSASYEAEAAAHTGTGYNVNGPEGSTDNVAGYYTSGGYNVGGLRTGSDVKLDFTVDVPEDGSYDLSIFSSTYNLIPAIRDGQGPTNVFVTVDGAAEQQVFLPLAYRWVVWDHADTTVQLTAGPHTITLSARSIDGSSTTQGDAIVDRITLQRSAAGDAVATYEAELADYQGSVDYSGRGTVTLAAGEEATFWVYGKTDAEATLSVLGTGTGEVSVNGYDVLDLGRQSTAGVHLEGGVNKVVVHGAAVIDAVQIGVSQGALETTSYQAEDAVAAGSAAVVDLSLAEGGQAVDGIGGDPDNGNTLTFAVTAAEAGPHAVVVRFANPEQYTSATHYNPNPMARPADISVNGGDAERVLFVPTLNRNNFWERTVVLDLREGANTVEFSSEEQKNFDGDTYFQDNWPGLQFRAQYAPIIDRITVSPLRADIVVPPVVSASVDAETGENGWLRSAATVSLRLTQGEGAIEYRVDGGEWQTYVEPVALITDGAHVVDYRVSVDGQPVASSAGSMPVNIDATAPVTSAAVTPEGGVAIVGTAATSVFSASDALSGIARTEYSVGGLPWQVVGSEGVSVTEKGTYAIRYRSLDVAGNVEQARQVVLTVADPAQTATVVVTSADEASADGWYQQAVIVSLSAPQAGQSVQYSINGGTWRTYRSGVSVTANGITTISHRLLADGAVVSGSIAQTTVKIDKTPPSVTGSRTPAGGKGTPRNPVTFTATAADAGSGVAGIEYRLNSGAWLATGDPLVLADVGEYVISYRSTDRAGNVSAVKSATVVIGVDPATVVKSSASVRPGGVLTITVSGFARWSDVELSVGETSLGQVLTGDNGSARITVRVPAALPRGAATLTATDPQTGLTAVTPLTVK